MGFMGGGGYGITPSSRLPRRSREGADPRGRCEFSAPTGTQRLHDANLLDEIGMFTQLDRVHLRINGRTIHLPPSYHPDRLPMKPGFHNLAKEPFVSPRSDQVVSGD